MEYTLFNGPFSPLFLAGDKEGLIRCSFNLIPEPGWYRNDEAFTKVKEQLAEYFKGSRKSFDLQLNPSGTAFQKSVWNALGKIPYGQTRTYKEIALAIGNPGACRAVGMANNKNPLAIIIPCHRVIGANGTLTGYAGGIDLKVKLLKLESDHSSDTNDCWRTTVLPERIGPRTNRTVATLSPKSSSCY